MTNMKKVTKKEKFAALKEIVAAASESMELSIEGLTFDTLIEFVDHEMELLDNKAVAAQKRAADKKTEGDALRERIYNVLSDSEDMTINQIVKALDDEEISPQMVTARLTQLVSPEVGKVAKTTVTVTPEGGKAKKLSAYRKIA